MGSATGAVVVVAGFVEVTGSVEVTEPDEDEVSVDSVVSAGDVDSVVSAGDVDSVDGSVVWSVGPVPVPPVVPPVGVGVGNALTV
jgi:hypothetical protein